MVETQERVCIPAGYTGSGKRIRAWCCCGQGTTPRASQARALAALLNEHGHSAPICALCQADYSAHDWDTIRGRDLEIINDPDTGKPMFLACRGMPRSCHDAADQHMLHLDRAVADGFGFELRTRLRLVHDGSTRTDTRPAP